MERDKYLSSLLYSNFDGLNSLILSDYMSENMSAVSFSIKNSLYSVSVHVCTNDYLRCTKYEVHDRVRKHVIRCTRKRAPRFLVIEALLYRIASEPR